MFDENLSFEQGPIRPPNEARSLLLRFTRNCPWNHCQFCPVYKGRKFSLRPVADIKADIQTARDIADDIRALSERLERDGRVDDHVISHIFKNAGYNDCYRSIAGWLYYETHACFLQDADNLIMKTDDLVEVLTFLRERFPDITRVTTYSRSKTASKKSADSLKRIREAGLDRIHIGLESGYDPVLKLMKKGTTAATQIDAGKKVMAAGMELSEYVMPGLGGQEMWEGHARETAKVLNQINPHFIRLRSLRVPERIPLYEKLAKGDFTLQTDDMLAKEIRLFIETLDGITSTITSDHIMNLLEEVSGKFPEDKTAMLDVIEKYQNLSDQDRLIYRTGRRGGTYRSTDDLHNDPATYHKIQNLVTDIRSQEGKDGLENFITGLADRYI
ncbi:MAG: radical SAM protein [Deltaproteobacteria bacterium]|nr:radical SAM protein [Deltaproteobacteria bacterium]